MSRSVRLFIVMATSGLMVFLLFLAFSTDTQAKTNGSTIKVPDDHPTIQAAIDAAVDDDTILVAAGTYTENLSVTKGITLSGGWDEQFDTRSPGNSIVDGSFQGRVIEITCTISSTLVTVDGFSIINGDASGLGAPGMSAVSITDDLPHQAKTPVTDQSADRGSPSEHASELYARLADLADRGLYPGGQQAYQAMLERLEIRTTQAEQAQFKAVTFQAQSDVQAGKSESIGGAGGGVHSWNCSLHLVNNTIENNLASEDTFGIGGGVYAGSAPTSGVIILDNYISENVGCSNGEGEGGGMYLFQTPGAVISHNIFNDNEASAYGNGQGGGLVVVESASAHIDNNEFLDNTASNYGDGLGGGLYVSQASGVVIEDSVFFENIAADGGEVVQGFGGGLMVDSSPNAVVRDNEIERNTANGTWQHGEGKGGGLFLSATDGVLVSDNAFRGNLATLRGMGKGGGLSLYQTENTRMEDNEVTGNWAVMYQASLFAVGGGIAMDSVYSTTLSANDIRENTAVLYEEGMASGGGISGAGLDGQTRLIGNIITDNTACSTGSCQGGGISIDGAQDVLVTDNTLTGNVSSLELGWEGVGGGMYLANTPNSQILRNRFQGNRAGDALDSNGGGLMVTNFESASGVSSVDANQFLDNQPGGCDVVEMGVLSFTNNVVANNKTSITGGLGLDFIQEGIVANNTIIDNNYYGITIGGSTTLTLVNNIVVSHTVGLVVKDGATATVRYTLWEGNDSDLGGDGTIIHSNPVYGAPAFRDPANHDYHLTIVSAALDAGDPAGVPPAPDHDADGVARPQGLSVDIGAYEMRWRNYLPLVMVR